jgi:hypothetical protein
MSNRTRNHRYDNLSDNALAKRAATTANGRRRRQMSAAIDRRVRYTAPVIEDAW